MPRKEFESFTRLDASDVNTFLMDQAVMSFAGTAARGSAITTPTEGMLTYLADSDSFEFFDGTSFLPLASEGPTVEYLVIAGGGGGALRASGEGAGGGGAGGYRTNVSGALSGGSVVAELAMPLVAATYPVVVGAGGAGVTSANTAGANGSFSAFANIVCIGGSRGQNATISNAVGGSGGGGLESRTAGSDPVFQQGFAGGNGSASFSGAAGGGGAGAAGANTTSSSGSAGGDGLASSITGSSVTRAGGGGGGGSSGSGGTGGAGGGGNGSINDDTSGSGTVNTGGGGGGGETGTSGAGGSGIVIFSVPTGTSVSFSGGVTETNSTVGDRQVYIVTATSTTSETVTFA
jgi:hypothetical protein